MKKTYISPALEVVKIQTAIILAASGEQTFSVSNEEVTSGWADARGDDFDYDE
ncbi:MAG: hypothetical protein IJU11_04210 [Prevotella sp.]|nr:hypothetical protein [Prevotella sp.]